MRNPLLVFFSGYNLNRYFIGLKFPRDIAVISSLRQKSLTQSGACQWRGLHSNWNLSGGAVTLLDFSRVKRYRLGFDTSLIGLKSPVALKQFRKVCFDINAVSFMGKHQFNSFFFNLGVYNSASNHNLALWGGVYSQLLKLSSALRIKHLVSEGGSLSLIWSNSYLPWKALYPHDALLWALWLSGKLSDVRRAGYLDDAQNEIYLTHFSEATPWVRLTTAGSLTDIFSVGYHEPTYILPEFYGSREVLLCPPVTDPLSEEQTPFSSFNVARFIETIFYHNCSDVTYSSSSGDQDWYQVFLLFCTLGGAE